MNSRKAHTARRRGPMPKQHAPEPPQRAAYTVLSPATTLWSLYLPHEPATTFSPETSLGQVVLGAHKFLTTFCSREWVLSLAQSESIPLHHGALRASACFPVDFDVLLVRQPARTLAAIALAAAVVIDRVHPNDTVPLDALPRRKVRIFGYDVYTALKDVRSSLLDTYVTIRTSVVRVSPIRPLVSRITFKCATCDTEQIVKLVDGKYVSPTACALENCRSKLFIPSRGADDAITIDSQRLRLQEKIFDSASERMTQNRKRKMQEQMQEQRESGNGSKTKPAVVSVDQEETGRIARTIDCELLGDCVDAVVPGDVVVVSGIVKFQTSQEDRSVSGGSGLNKSKAAQMFNIYIEANSIRKISATIESNMEPNSNMMVGSNQQQVGGKAISGIPLTQHNNCGSGSSISRPLAANNMLFAGLELQNSSNNSTGDTKDFTIFSYKDLYCIQEICKLPDAFRALVHSLVPSIYGHELVKAGLLLALMGGRQRSVFAPIEQNNDSIDLENENPNTQLDNNKKDSRRSRKRNQTPNSTGSIIRAEPHILIVGDPGLGKSQMLSAVCKLAPRGIYVSGNATTTSGLTVTMSKDPDSGDTALEAGALVLGDQGICCIDELDKMKDHSSLLEAMEQQSVSIAKAGTVCSLPARTSVLAAANPKGGHFDPTRSINDNIKLNSALLSRFDLVFILLDTPDENLDKALSDHVLKIHNGSLPVGGGGIGRNIIGDSSNGSGGNRISHDKATDGLLDPSIVLEPDDPRLLESRLRYGKFKLNSQGEIVPESGNGLGAKNAHGADIADQQIPEHLIRKYLSYARRFCHPRLTKESAKVIRDFYLTLRKESRTTNNGGDTFMGTTSTTMNSNMEFLGDAGPVTTRQLESLIRLAEARARCELRERVSVQDARDAIALVRASRCPPALMASIQDSANEGGMSNAVVNTLLRGENPNTHRKSSGRTGQARKLLASLHKIAVQTRNDGEFTRVEVGRIADVMGIAPGHETDAVIETLNGQGFLIRKVIGTGDAAQRVFKLTSV